MRNTREVKVGGVMIGGNNKVSIQSMTNTKTTDIDATIAQIIRLQNAGCDIVRCSAPDKASALAFKEITSAVNIPIVADIHFDYKLAMLSADNGVSKIRINPGNIGGVNNVKMLADYLNERNIPIRVGVNAGSLENDLVNTNLSKALVESALKHIRMLEDCNFYNTIISVKASCVKEMVNAYRLLSLSTDYPLHLGVTEAGIMDSSIIKSSIGIGGLLLDDIGDTIRVSVSGDVVNEVLIAKRILNALDLGEDFVEVISCPTCARCGIDVEKLATEVTKLTKNIKKRVKIAVMGCVVNGPGEAKHCDFGVAGGKEKSAIFKNGQVLKTVDNNQLMNEIKSYIDSLL